MTVHCTFPPRERRQALRVAHEARASLPPPEPAVFRDGSHQQVPAAVSASTRVEPGYAAAGTLHLPAHAGLVEISETLAAGLDHLLARPTTGAGAAASTSPPTSPLDAAASNLSRQAHEEVLAERHLQIVKWKHTPEKDLDAPADHLPRMARDLCAAALDDLQFNRGPAARRDALPKVRQRLIRAGATILAALDRIDAEGARLSAEADDATDLWMDRLS